MPRFKNIILIKIALKLSYFCEKIQKFQALGALPPDSRVSGGWGLRSQTQNQSPNCEFLVTRLNRFRENQTSRSSKVIYKNEIISHSTLKALNSSSTLLRFDNILRLPKSITKAMFFSN